MIRAGITVAIGLALAPVTASACPWHELGMTDIAYHQPQRFSPFARALPGHALPEPAAPAVQAPQTAENASPQDEQSRQRTADEQASRSSPGLAERPEASLSDRR